MPLQYVKLLADNPRVQVVLAIETTIDRYFAGEELTSIAMPPRVGKSTVIRGAALEFYEITRMPSVMLAPWVDNVEQIKDPSKITAMYRQYGIPLPTPFNAHRCQSMPTNGWWQTTSGVPTLITATLGLVNNKANQQQFLDGINDLYQRTGRRVPVFADECHLIKDKKEFGKLVRRVVEHGGYVVLLTGTPVPGIPGFEEQYDDWIEIKRSITRRKYEHGEIKYIRENYEGERRAIEEIVADVNMTWKEAFNIGALCRTNAIWIDVDVTTESGESLGPLSGIDEAELSGRLKRIMESDEMTAKMAIAGLERFLTLRTNEQTAAAQMLILSGSDVHIGKASRSNDHARKYRGELEDALERLGLPRNYLRIAIATGTDNYGNPDAASAALLKEFRDGHIDVLIVKAMGIVGLDVEPCKVLIFGSTLRGGPMALQALSRVLTQWRCRANMILPKDKRMVALYNRAIKDEDGEYSESNLTLVDVVEINAPDAQEDWTLHDPRIASYSDETGQEMTGDHEIILLAIKDKYRVTEMSDIEIITNYQLGAFPLSDDEKTVKREVKTEQEASGIRDLDVDLDKIKGTFGRDAGAIITKYVDYGSNRTLWLNKLKELQAEAKKLCGIENRKVGDVDDVLLLRRLKDALPHAEKIVFKQ